MTLRVGGKHIYNPANLGVICAFALVPGAWVSSGQWGNDLLLAVCRLHDLRPDDRSQPGSHALCLRCDRRCGAVCMAVLAVQAAWAHLGTVPRRTPSATVRPDLAR